MSASYGNGIRDHVDCGISTVQLNCMLRESPYGLPTLISSTTTHTAVSAPEAQSAQKPTTPSTIGVPPVFRPPILLPTVSLIRLRPKMSKNSILPISSASSSTGAMGSSSAYPGLRDDEFESLGRSGRSLGVRLRRLTKFKTMVSGCQEGLRECSGCAGDPRAWTLSSSLNGKDWRIDLEARRSGMIHKNPADHGVGL